MIRLAHLADVHLGFRRYTRSGPRGVNQRELDVAQAFQAAMDRVREEAPDLVVIAGDLFHTVRPSNAAIALAFRQLRETVEELSAVHVVLVAGNHDLPRDAATGCVLPLFREIPRTHVAWERPERFETPHGVVWAVPEGHDVPEACEGVLVLHGEIEGTLPQTERPVHRIPKAALDGWRYVALGHYHTRTAVTPRAWYAGATEYTSSDPWAEARSGTPKAWLLVSLDGDRLTVDAHETAARRHVDLPVIDATDLGPEDVDAALAQHATDLTDAVVRQVVTNITRSVRRNLDHAAIRQYQQAALHYHFDPRTRVDAHTAPIDFALAQQTLRETVRQRLVARGGESLAALGMAFWDGLDEKEAEQFARDVAPEVGAA